MSNSNDSAVKGEKLKALTDAWADTTTPTGKLILSVLCGLAEFKRSLIAERTDEGRERSKRAGRRLGTLRLGKPPGWRRQFFRRR
jgi:DNA invertase Pin-like site-specific DNA recombinase